MTDGIRGIGRCRGCAGGWISTGTEGGTGAMA